MRCIRQAGWLLGCLILASPMCLGQMNTTGKWTHVKSNVLSFDVPEGWAGRLKWDRPHGFLVEITTKDFLEKDITSAVPDNSGLFVNSGARILLLGSWQQEQPTEDILRSKAKTEVRTMPDRAVENLPLPRGKCCFSRWKYGAGQEETAIWCGFYSSMENRDLVKVSMTYSAASLKDEEVTEMMKRLLMSLQYSRKGYPE